MRRASAYELTMKGTESAPAIGISFTRLDMMVSPASTLPLSTAARMSLSLTSVLLGWISMCSSPRVAASTSLAIAIKLTV